jgi:hypothetical protein
MSKKLFEKKMKKFLKTLFEQEDQHPLAQEITQQGTEDTTKTVNPDPTQKPNVAQTNKNVVLRDPNIDLENVPKDIKFIDTKRLFYTKPPADSNQWIEEINQYPQYSALKDRIAPFLVSKMVKDFKIQEAGAARYNPFQFRISLIGTLNSEAKFLIDSNEQTAELYELKIRDVHGSNTYHKDDIEQVIKEPLKIEGISKQASGVDLTGFTNVITKRAMNIIKDQKLKISAEDIKSKITKSVLDDIEDDVRNGKITLDDVKAEKDEALAKIDKSINSNIKSFGSEKETTEESEVKEYPPYFHYLVGLAINYGKYKRSEAITTVKEILDKNEPKSPLEAVELLKKASPEAQEIPKVNKEKMKYNLVYGIASGETMGLMKKEAKSLADFVIKNYSDKINSDDEIETVKFVLSKKEEWKKEQNEDYNIESYLKKLLLEAKSESKTAKGSFANIINSINKSVEDLMDNNSLIANKGGDIKTCLIQFGTCTGLHFDANTINKFDKNSKKIEKIDTWDKKSTPNILIEGNLKFTINMLFDARLVSGLKKGGATRTGGTWEFRIFHKPGTVITRKF